ncbi:hypothetical protein P7C71_g4214, partial [Lecanoromycetidae sp. Uapishka_2]
MVIDLEAFNNISVNDVEVAQVGGGVRLGYSSRGWGLTLDTIVGLDVVLANGSFVHANSIAYPDVFWALRGAAESIGIVTTFYFQTQPAPSSIINWAYNIPITSSDAAASTFSHIQNFALNASVIDGLTGFGVSPTASSFSISGTYRGDQATFTNEIAPELLRGLPTPSSQSVQSLNWISSLTNLWGGPLAQPLTGYNAHDDFYAKSVLVPEASPLTMPALSSYFNYIATNGTQHPALWFSELNLIGGPGSMVNSPPAAAADAAYSERGALWIVQHYSEIPSASSGGANRAIAFVDGLNSALENPMPSTAFGGYLNYVDPELSAAQAHALYYSSAVYDRLSGIKKVVDPGNVFSNPQSVGM